MHAPCPQLFPLYPPNHPRPLASPLSATSLHHLSFPPPQGKSVWQARQPAPITAMAPFKYQPKLINGVLLGLANGEVRLYNDQHLLNTLTLPNGKSWGGETFSAMLPLGFLSLSRISLILSVFILCLSRTNGHLLWTHMARLVGARCANHGPALLSALLFDDTSSLFAARRLCPQSHCSLSLFLAVVAGASGTLVMKRIRRGVEFEAERIQRGARETKRCQ